LQGCFFCLQCFDLALRVVAILRKLRSPCFGSFLSCAQSRQLLRHRLGIPCLRDLLLRRSRDFHLYGELGAKTGHALGGYSRSPFSIASRGGQGLNRLLRSLSGRSQRRCCSMVLLQVRSFAVMFLICQVTSQSLDLGLRSSALSLSQAGFCLRRYRLLLQFGDLGLEISSGVGSSLPLRHIAYAYVSDCFAIRKAAVDRHWRCLR
jgi:hypothetical protein